MHKQHLADLTVELPLLEEIPDRVLKLYVNESSDKNGRRTEVALKEPNKATIKHPFVFRFKISNNQVEYEALVTDLALKKDLVLNELTTCC